MIILLFIYLLALYLTGKMVLIPWKKQLDPILYEMGSSLAGTALGVPVTYFFTVFFSASREPMFWGVLAYILIAGIVTARRGVLRLPVLVRKNAASVSIKNWRDILFIVFAFLVSTWLMEKTLRGGEGGLLYVGSNTVFDFGNSIGLIRSMSWGHNFPVTSPFETGAPYFYHFFFYFLVAIWEYFGVPLHLAINIPSIISFALMLTVVYYFPGLFGKKFRIAGIIAVLLTLTNTSLTFWHLLINSGGIAQFFRSLWIMQKYPFAGPYDGAMISIYMTLNNFMNQRHLAFSIALGLFLYFLLVKSLQKDSLTPSQVIALGVCAGLLMLWNVSIWIVALVLLIMTLFIYRKWKQTGLFLIISAAVSLLINIPYVHLIEIITAYLVNRAGSTPTTNQLWIPSWSLGEYLWENLGILPFLSIVSLFYFLKRKVYFIISIFVLFTGLCLYAGYRHMGFDQKFLSFLIIGINIILAAWLAVIWEGGKIIRKLLIVFIVLILSISGFVDLFPIKNEFAYPFIDKKNFAVINWIHYNTDRHDVLLSKADIVDPVVLAGRRNFFGFYGNINWEDRTETVKRIYAGDKKLAQDNGIQYILIPSGNVKSLPYVINIQALTDGNIIVFSDDDFKLIKIL